MALEPTAALPLAPGSVLAGHRIERALGHGGFGAVYEATDLALARPVALKVLHPDPTGQVLARFRDEARLLARLNHPNVIQIYRIDQMPGGAPFLTMELFGDGHLGKHFGKGVASPVAACLAAIDQVLAALEAAHARGVVHRDIKEANLLMDRSTGRVKVCDFGIARALEPMTGEAAPTGGAVLGTPHYVAPERFRGIHDDPRSDLYAVGVVLYRLLTGRRPYETPGASALAIAHRIVSEDAAPPAQVPAPVARFCTRLLARDLELRFPTAAAARAELPRLGDQPATAALPPAAPALPLPAPVAAPVQGRRAPLWPLALLLAGGVAVGVAWFTRGPEGPHPAPERASAAGTAPVDAAVDSRPADAAAVDQGPADQGRPDAAPASRAPRIKPRRPRRPRPPATAARPTKAPAPRPASRAPTTRAPSRVPSRRPRSTRALENPIVTPDE